MKILFIHEVNYRAKVVFEMHEFPELLSLAGHEVQGVQWHARVAGEGGAMGLAAHLAVAVGQLVDGGVYAIAHDAAQATTGMRLHGFFPPVSARPAPPKPAAISGCWRVDS